MGSLTYDRVVIQIDDRTLAHLQIVIVVKLRRGESFLLSWRDAATVGAGRSSVWLNPGIPLYFKFAGGRTPAINPDWIERLARSAEGAQGLVIIGENGPITGTEHGAPRPHPSFSVQPARPARQTLVSED